MCEGGGGAKGAFAPPPPFLVDAKSVIELDKLIDRYFLNKIFMNLNSIEPAEQ